MRRLDHAMTFILIAGSHTPVALLMPHGTLGAGTCSRGRRRWSE